MKTLTIIELKNLTVSEFAKVCNISIDNIKKYLRETASFSYTTDSTEHLKNYVTTLEIDENKKENVFNFLHVNLFNSPLVPFYNGRGWGIELKATIR